MDHACRLVRARAERSTCYQEKLEGLSREHRRIVEAMETQLFEERRRASGCTVDHLPLPNARFDCPEGSIWFHFVSRRKVFILSDFALNGSGGNRADIEGMGFVDNCRWSFSFKPASGDSIAARLAHLLRAQLSPAVDWAAWLSVEQAAPLHVVYVDDLCVELDSPTISGQLLMDIAASCHVLRDFDAETILPTWSLLRRASEAREQLENPYARSIFAGEALCRLTHELGNGRARALRWGPLVRRARRAWLKCAPAELYAESTAILDAILAKRADASLGKQVGHFLTASLMDDDMLGDLRRLTLIRSEMTYRLATSIGWHSARTSQARQRDTLRRYAMLSEFVHLSADYFGVGEAIIAGADVLEDLDACRHRDRAVVHAVMRDLDDFGSSTMMIVEQLTPPRQSEARNRDADHARLCWLASQILVVDAATGAAPSR